MPITIQGDTSSRAGAGSIIDTSVDFNYKYPNKLDLRPGSALHNRIKSAVMDRAMASRRVMEKKYSTWKEIDRTLTAYISPDIKRESRKRGDKTIPIVIPVTYATMQTLLTYLSAAFLRNPIFEYEGAGPEDTIGGILLQNVIQHHCTRLKVGLQLHTLWRDSLAYGVSAASPIWEVQRGFKTVIKNKGFVSRVKGVFIDTGIERTTEETIIYEGNRLENIDPYMFLPDPNVPIHEIQRGEFIGWITKTNRLDLLTEERSSDGFLFNVKYLQRLKGSAGRSSLVKSDSTVHANTGRQGETGSDVTSRIDVINMYINLIPKEWKIGNKDYPEKWLFQLAADEVVIAAQPLNLDHGQYPVVSASPDYDGYSLTPLSRSEVVHGMQDVIDFLYNSHIDNIRKAINDMIVYDPSILNSFDMEEPGPGKMVRLRRSAWGRGLLNDAVKQLDVKDVTGGHVKDVGVLMEIIQKVTGATDAISGIMRKGGERRSATESRGAMTASLSKLEKDAKIISMQAHQDIAYQFASNAQQLMEEDAYIKILGDMPEELAAEYGKDVNRVRVSPQQIVVPYDVIPHDGSMPGGESPELWIQLFQILSTNNAVGAEFDMVRVFMHVARQLGAKNLEDFRNKTGSIQAQVVEDEIVQNQVARGNLVPANGEAT